MLLLDAAIHALEGEGRAVTGVAAAKFLLPVGPGEPLVLAWAPVESGRANFELRLQGQRAATGALLLAPENPP